ncbi:MAG: ATP-binding protein [Gaiellales bacterium]
MSRVPIRIRLTLAFTLGMAIVLAGVGAFLYARLGESLRDQLDEGLEVRAEALSTLVAEGADLEPSLRVSEDDEGFTQVLGRDGSVVATSPSVGEGPLATPDELARALAAPLFLRRDDVPGLAGEPARLLLTPATGADGPVVLLVGGSLEDVEEALDGLLAQLFIAGPLALLLTSLAGYFLAAAALRPVEAMRRRAAGIGSDASGQRLPLPAARDEIHRLGETLNAMLDRLEAGIARERRFVADASHELRTPLGLLQAELELALRRPRSREELEDALRSAAEEADRLARLAEDLLVLARLDEGGLPLQRVEILPGDLLATVTRRFESRARAGGRSLAVDAAPGLEVVGDPLRLEQALGNLVDNALLHGAGTVRLEATGHDGLVELRVADEGPGFPPGFLPRAFDRFARGDEARGSGASGLGLAIVRAIAEAHGGRARAANLGPNGAVVTIALPRETPVAEVFAGSGPDA